MRPQLQDVTATEIVNGSYEAIKMVMSSRLAMMVAPDDPLMAKRLFEQIAEEIDDARHDFIVMLREATSQAEVEGEIVG